MNDWYKVLIFILATIIVVDKIIYPLINILSLKNMLNNTEAPTAHVENTNETNETVLASAPVVDVEAEVVSGDNAPSESASNLAESPVVASDIPVVVDTSALKDEHTQVQTAFNAHLQNTQAYMQKITSNKDLKIHFIENGLVEAAEACEKAIGDTYKLLAKALREFADKL